MRKKGNGRAGSCWSRMIRKNQRGMAMVKEYNTICNCESLLYLLSLLPLYAADLVLPQSSLSVSKLSTRH